MPSQTQTEAIIYLAEQRACTQSNWQRSYHTFYPASDSKNGNAAWGNLKIVNDDTLKGRHTFNYSFDEDMQILLLPIVGGLSYQHGINAKFIEVGESQLVSLPKGEKLAITNTYELELINFICVGWNQCSAVENSHYSFDLDAGKNKMITMPAFSIGKFGGREEEVYQLKNPDKGIFAFVVEGAFELQNRLLQPRDGLALWNTTEIEFEALSEGAILLLIEPEEDR